MSRCTLFITHLQSFPKESGPVFKIIRKFEVSYDISSFRVSYKTVFPISSECM